MRLIILPLLISVAMAADMAMNLDGAGGYNFNYNTGDAGSHSRSESGSGGSVSGSYSYIDPNGNLRQVSYTAGPDGFKPSGDISVDKKTAEEAAKIAALAPKAPEAPAHSLSAPAGWHWPAAAPWYGAWQSGWNTPWYGAWHHGAWAPGANWGYWWESNRGSCEENFANRQEYCLAGGFYLTLTAAQWVLFSASVLRLGVLMTWAVSLLGNKLF